MAGSVFTMRDGAYSCTAKLYKGDGIIFKGVLRKKVLSFIIELEINKKGGYANESGSYCMVACRDNSVKKFKISEGINRLEIPVSQISLPSLTATVVACIKLEGNKTKKMKITLSNNF